MLVVVLLCAVGVVGGYGLGQAVDGARGLLAGPESLPADKVAAPEPLDVGGPATTCRADDVELRLSSSAPTVTAGSPMSFMVRVTNVGRVPCLFDGSAASRAVTITSDTGDEGKEGDAGDTGDAAKEKVWSSADCAEGSRPLLLGPEDVNAGEVHWTSVQGCAKKAPVVGAGTYEATASLEDVPGATSEPLTFTVAAKAEAKTTPTPDDGDEDTASGDAAKGAADGDATDDATQEETSQGDAKSGDAKSGDAKGAADRAADRKATADEKATTD